MRGRVAAGVLAVLLLVVAGAAPLAEGRAARIVLIAHAVALGRAQPGWEGGAIPYSWGGGHGEDPGPSLGTCRWYRGSIRPCPADRTRGLDCSGLVRWVYHLAFGRDVLGPGNTDEQVRRLRKVPRRLARPGDLVFYGKVTKRKVKTHHVGIYLGDGRMINALRTGTVVRVDDVTAVKPLAGYFRYVG